MSLLSFFPPAPGEGSRSILELPADDWICQAKMDGDRVVVSEGRCFTRQATPLSPSRALLQLLAILRPLGSLPLIEGEWVRRNGAYYLFDLPEHRGPYEERFRAVRELVHALDRPGVRVVRYTESDFRAFWEAQRGQAEGVVMKRRASLYRKCARAGMETRDWLKRRYSWESR